MKGFRDFILRGNVVDLAIAVLIGAAFGSVVTAFTDNLLSPLIALAGGTPDLGSLSFSVGGTSFPYGRFLNAVISFLIIAAVLYFLVVVPVGRLMARYRPEPAPAAPTRECPECTSKIPQRARRCSFCTVQVEPVSA